MAEYKALISALTVALDKHADDITVHLDSELIVRQLNGQYRVKNKGLLPLYHEVTSLLERFRCYNIYHIPREENRDADALAKRGSMQRTK